MKQFSYSRVSCYKSCPYQFKLRYIDQLETIPNTDANNALYLGSAMHTGIEKTVKDALAQYYANYPLLDDLHINEAMKLEHLIPLAKKCIPRGAYEVKIETDEFKGFMDLLVPKKRKNHFDIYDFKYVSGEIGYELVYRMDNVDNMNDYYECVPTRKLQQYLKSVQLHVYKYFYELTHPGHVIDKLYYVFIPKTQIRQKNSKKEKETLYEFRKRLQSELDKMKIMVEEVEFDFQKVRDYLEAVEEIKAATEYPKNCTKLCDWCEYKQYCKEGDTTMITMPKIERRKLNVNNYKKRILLFGAPTSGKTFFANKFPKPLMLNTDCNTDLVNATVMEVKNQVTTVGRTTEVMPAWEYFIELVDMLEREQTNPERPKTIIVDVLDHILDDCRDVKLEKAGIEHETDAGFGKGFDLVRKPFVQEIKRLLLLDYETIILISHEDVSSSVTRRDGSSVSRIKTTLPDKVANQIAGLINITGWVHVENGVRKLTFPKDGLFYNSNRLPFKQQTIPLSYRAFTEAYNEALQIMAEMLAKQDAADAEGTVPAPETPATEAPVRRRVAETPATK